MFVWVLAYCRYNIQYLCIILMSKEPTSYSYQQCVDQVIMFNNVHFNKSRKLSFKSVDVM